MGFGILLPFCTNHQAALLKAKTKISSELEIFILEYDDVKCNFAIYNTLLNKCLKDLSSDLYAVIEK